MIIAQISDLVSVNLAGWLACLAFLVGLVNGILKVTDRFAGRPATGNFATQEEVKEVRKSVEASKVEGTNRRRVIYDRIDEVDKQAEAKIKKVEEAMREEIATLREQYHNDLKSINSRIDTIPDRVITTLRNTGALE